MTLHLYNPRPPPEYSYTHTYSAVVQLYARSSQLATADLLYSRRKLDSFRCRIGCDAIEDQHCVFVVCEHYSSWRTKEAEQVYRRTDKKLEEKGIEG
ncbi:hypothetical protein B0H13DRAFT_95450 [Mycena leptocephala]|nr:hypothetical protein B0H13DRAFT_95450 [Mycena leptocephala]